MESSNYKVYGYRWIVLLVFMCVIAINQVLWITFAAITGNAAIYYGVSDLSIGLLSMSFMIVYILVSIPAFLVMLTAYLLIKKTIDNDRERRRHEIKTEVRSQKPEDRFPEIRAPEARVTEDRGQNIRTTKSETGI